MYSIPSNIYIVKIFNSSGRGYGLYPTHISLQHPSLCSLVFKKPILGQAYTLELIGQIYIACEWNCRDVVAFSHGCTSFQIKSILKFYKF